MAAMTMTMTMTMSKHRDGTPFRDYTEPQKLEMAEWIFRDGKDFSITRVSDDKVIAWFIFGFWFYSIVQVGDYPVRFLHRTDALELVKEIAKSAEILITDIK